SGDDGAEPINRPRDSPEAQPGARRYHRTPMTAAAHGGRPEGRPFVRREPGIAVRPAVAADAGAIARVLTEALEDKFRPAFGASAARAMTAVVRRDLQRQRLSYWVAERDR